MCLILVFILWSQFMDEESDLSEKLMGGIRRSSASRQGCQHRCRQPKGWIDTTQSEFLEHQPETTFRFAFLGRAVMSARSSWFTDSRVVNTSAMSGSTRTTKGASLIRAAKRLARALR